MSEDKCGYDDSVVEDSALGLDFKGDGYPLHDEDQESDDDKDPEDDPEWAFTPSGTAGDKFEADMDSSWVTMRMISHFISVAQPDLEEFLLKKMDDYFSSENDGGKSGSSRTGAGAERESKGQDHDEDRTYSSQQYEIYQEYCELFESSMKHFSDEHTQAEIVNTLKESNQCAESGRETMGAILLDMLEALSDFREFDLMFTEKRNEDLGLLSCSSESKK